jgi:ABC-type transport system involved in resistance to organic solvents, periplasmic component
MARRLSWSDVRGGLLACLVIAAAAVAVLTFMRVGALHGDTFPLYAIVGEARGVTKGSEVWLSGQKIGKITDIQFRSPASADTSSRILIAMEVLEEHRHAIHRDAVAQIRSGGSVIGPAVVYMSPGTPRAAPLQAGDTVHTLKQSDVEAATAQFAGAARELPVIMANVSALRAQLQTSEGTAGAFMNGPGFGELQRARIQTSLVMGRITGQGGSIGPIMRGGLTSRAGRTLARVDSVRALLASPNASVGRFRRDSTLLSEVGDIRNELTLVRAALDEPRGTAGRVLHDSALTNALGQAEREMTLLFADIKKHPRRYLSVSF